MERAKEKPKKSRRKKLILIPIVLILAILIPVILIVNSNIPRPNIDDFTGLEVEESIDFSYSQWTLGTQYRFTRVGEAVDGSLVVVDCNRGYMASATLNFNKIDIGHIKMQMSAPTTSQLYFAMEFRSDASTLFKIERLSDVMTFVVSGGQPMIIVDLEAEWRTFDIVFDLTKGDNCEVSVLLDGVITIDKFSFDPENLEVNNIYIHTSTSIYQSRTDIKFEYLYNLLAT